VREYRYLRKNKIESEKQNRNMKKQNEERIFGW
jgi:hypothetical protein